MGDKYSWKTFREEIKYVKKNVCLFNINYYDQVKHVWQLISVFALIKRQSILGVEADVLRKIDYDAAVVLHSWCTVAKKNLLNETDVEGLEENACELVKIWCIVYIVGNR